MTILTISQFDRGPAIAITGEIMPSAIAVAAPYGPAARLSATSNSAVTNGNSGTKTFVLNEIGCGFVAGVRVRATAIPDGQWMEGVAFLFNATTRTLSFTADLSSGAVGVYSYWTINVAGQQGQKGNTGETGAVGPSGGPIGPTGPDGASNGNKYAFSTAVSGDPGSGKFLLNNANLTLATALNVSETDANGFAMAAMLGAVDDSTSSRKSVVRLTNPGGVKGIIGHVTGTLTDQGTYDTYPWTPITSWGGLLSDDVMYLSWSPVGDKGDTGLTGATGPVGPVGPQGIVPEAPINGTTYGRNNATWHAVSDVTATTTPSTPVGNVSATNVQAAIQELDAEKVSKAGDTMSGVLTISKSNPTIILNRTDSAAASIYGQKSNASRWQIDLGDAIAEDGSNAGSDFNLYGFNNAVNAVTAALKVRRNSGLIQFGNAVAAITPPITPCDGNVWAYNYTTVVNGSFGINAYINSALTEWRAISNGVAATIYTTGGGLFLNVTATPATAGAALPPVVQAWLKTTGEWQCQAGCCFSTAQTGFKALSAGGYNTLEFNPGYNYSYEFSSGILTLWMNSEPKWSQGFSGNFLHYNAVTTNVQGYKPGGGAWVDSSDARIKTVQGDYTSGLAEVLTLHPVRYTFKGNDTAEDVMPSNDRTKAVARRPHNADDPPEEPAPQETATLPYANSHHYNAAASGREFIGLIAQECETVFPEMVAQHSATIDGIAVTDMRILDTAPLIFALINAIKELNARIAALEAPAT
jgi:hypothetical protein